MCKTIGSVHMIITVKSMRKPTKKMALVEDAGTTVESKRANSKTDNLMVSADRFLKTDPSLVVPGLKVGDTAKEQKNLRIVSFVLAPGATTIISTIKLPSEHQ